MVLSCLRVGLVCEGASLGGTMEEVEDVPELLFDISKVDESGFDDVADDVSSNAESTRAKMTSTASLATMLPLLLGLYIYELLLYGSL